MSRSSAWLGGFYAALVFWWIFLFTERELERTNLNYGFAFAYGMIPLIGGIVGLVSSRRWGFFKSSVGRSIIFFSLGLISWATGEVIWSIYNLLGYEVPYPSESDIFFPLSWPLYGIGLYFLSFATGARFGLKENRNKLALLIVPVSISVLTYLVFVVPKGGLTNDLTEEGCTPLIALSPLSCRSARVFFDILYPALDLLVLTEAVIIFGLSIRFIGGLYRWPIYTILLGLFVNYFADSAFIYTTYIGSFYNGSWVDLIQSTSLFIIAFGVNNFTVEPSWDR